MDLNQFTNIFINIEAIFWVIVFFGGSIFIHELGHFLAARARGLKVERFSIGFGPRIFGWKKNGVDYRLCLFPLGGYVALPQLAQLETIEGSYTKESLPEASYTDKLLVLLMGVTFNLLFALVLSTLLWVIGSPSSQEEQTTRIGYVPQTVHISSEKTVPGPAYLAGLKAGDIVQSVDGTPVKHFSEIEQLLVTSSGRDVSGNPQSVLTVNRGEETLAITVNPVLATANTATGENLRVIGLLPAHTIEVENVMPGSPAAQAGIIPNDTILSLNGTRLYSMAALSAYLEIHPDEAVTLTIQRDGKNFDTILKPIKVAYTQPSILLSAKEDPEATLTLIPATAEKTPQLLLSESSPLSALTVYAIKEGSQGKRFEGLISGDRILGVLNKPSIDSLEAFTNQIQSLNTNPSFIIQRAKEGSFVWTAPSSFQAVLTPSQTHAMLGIVRKEQPIIVHIPVWEQFSNSIRMTFRVLQSLFSKGSDVGVNNLMGPPGIMRVLHTFSTIDLRLVLAFAVLLNINLAIINLLPLPVLDGGQIVFATITRLRGRPLPPRLTATIQETFLLALLGLILYVSFFDVRRWQGDNDLENQLELKSQFYIQPAFEAKDLKASH